MRAWLLALAACGAAPTVIGNRAPLNARNPETHASRFAVSPYAGCDETGCPLQLRVALPVDPAPILVPPIELASDRQATDLERDMAIRHRKLILVSRFEY